MTRPDCQPFQHQIQSGALLKAGIRLSPVEQHSLQNHLLKCADCQALANQIAGLDGRLRVSLHSRWDALPRPAKISPKLVQTKLRKQTMLRNMRTLAGTALVLLIVIGAFFTFRQVAPAGMTREIINPLPEDVMLKTEDMPSGTQYYFPDGASSNQLPPRIVQIGNGWYTYYTGEEKAAKFIKDTERKDGWFIEFQRYNANDPGIDLIRNWMTIHETPQGAQTFVKNFFQDDFDSLGLLSEYQSPKNWESLGPVNNLGDIATASKFSNLRAPGWENVTYLVHFAYRNVTIRVAVLDRSDRVTLQDAIYYAQIVMKRLQASH